MAKYEIVFTRDTVTGRKLMFKGLLNKPFTNKVYKQILSDLFKYACIDYEYTALTAEIKHDGKSLFFVFLDTYVDGSKIYSIVKIARPREKKQFVRKMVIAE